MWANYFYEVPQPVNSTLYNLQRQSIELKIEIAIEPKTLTEWPTGPWSNENKQHLVFGLFR